MQTTRTIDCVEIQHSGGEAVRRATQGMSREQEAAYWAEQTRQFRDQIRAARDRAASTPTPAPR